MSIKLICDTNIFYRIAVGSLKKSDFQNENEDLCYSPIPVIELLAFHDKEVKNRREEFEKRRAAAKVVVALGATALPDPDSYLATVFGYELANEPFYGIDGIKAFASSNREDELGKGIPDYYEKKLRTVYLPEIANWCSSAEAGFVDAVIKHLGEHIPGFSDWYNRDNKSIIRRPRLSGDLLQQYEKRMLSDDAFVTVFLDDLQISALERSKGVPPSEDNDKSRLYSAAKKLECYIAVYIRYLITLVGEGRLPEPNDCHDLALFLYSSSDEHVIVTGDKFWIRLARRAGYSQRVREVSFNQYNPREFEARWLRFWDERGYFHSDPDPSRTAYTIVIPPPNVTGALHLGHALNNTLQDILIRWRRMQGYNALWLPGTDHAGIATQAMVERRIREAENLTRHQLGREELVKRIWTWKDQYEARILGQLRSLGASCDWRRTRFTLDPICARAVRETFFKMFRDGLIYRGKRLVNWDAQLQTSVADDETYVENIKGGFWTFKYPVKDEPGAFIRFSTTRPETMLGDTAVCVHPGDERFKHLIGKKVTIPLVNRDVPIIADGLLADPTLGTGCVKVTPAHDPNDYACGLRNKLPMINILHPDGTINENGGKYAGMDRYKAREAVVADMEALGLFEGREDREIPLAHSDRSKTPIEPYLSDQWFVRFADHADGRAGLAQLAIDAVKDGRVRFFPERYARSYLDWLAEKRDWCVSRQLWWGHRIPIWYTRAPESELKRAFAGRPDVAWTRDEENGQWLVCAVADLPANALGGDYPLEQDPDVLDTWFSSALWPHSTLGWPEPTPELEYYYPTNTLVTSRDIITLWVARMVMTGLYNVGKIPFHHVYIHPKILDGFGEGMSKMKGNGIDPLDIIERYGTDALRFQMAYMATDNQDSRMPVANVCPHCGELIPVKQEHMYMRTRKIPCPKCKGAFRPGGPWPADDPELPTAKQASDRFDMGRNFANKLWNAARFLLMNLEGYSPGKATLTEAPLEDRWILSRLASTSAEVTGRLEGYHFSDAVRALYDFTWSEFCDWYVEMSKGRLRNENTRPLAQRVLAGVLDGILRLVQPFMPFVAESLWQALGEAAGTRGLPDPAPSAESVCIAAWPAYPEEWRDEAMETRLRRMQDLVRDVREVRNRYMIDARTPLDVNVRCSLTTADDFRLLSPFIVQLAGVGKLTCGPDAVKPRQAVAQVHADFDLYVSLLGLIDPAAETARLEKQKTEKVRALQAARAKLQNTGFMDRAPEEVKQQVKDQTSDLEAQLKVIEETLRDLQEG